MNRGDQSYKQTSCSGRATATFGILGGMFVCIGLVLCVVGVVLNQQPYSLPGGECWLCLPPGTGPIIFGVGFLFVAFVLLLVTCLLWLAQSLTARRA